jgi:hypothetical protein
MAIETDFRALTGFAPLSWQRRLYAEHFAGGRIPLAVDVPTGSSPAARPRATDRRARHNRSGRPPDFNLPRRGPSGSSHPSSRSYSPAPTQAEPLTCCHSERLLEHRGRHLTRFPLRSRDFNPCCRLFRRARSRARNCGERMQQGACTDPKRSPDRLVGAAEKSAGSRLPCLTGCRRHSSNAPVRSRTNGSTQNNRPGRVP